MRKSFSRASIVKHFWGMPSPVLHKCLGKSHKQHDSKSQGLLPWHLWVPPFCCTCRGGRAKSELSRQSRGAFHALAKPSPIKMTWNKGKSIYHLSGAGAGSLCRRQTLQGWCPHMTYRETLGSLLFLLAISSRSQITCWCFVLVGVLFSLTSPSGKVSGFYSQDWDLAHWLIGSSQKLLQRSLYIHQGHVPLLRECA